MITSSYLLFEISDTLRERILFMKNELNHYEIIFKKHGVHSLLNIITNYKIEIELIEQEYKNVIINLEKSINMKSQNAQDYELLFKINNNLESLWENIKYVIYSIFDSSLRRRLDYQEITKNHIITKKLCEYFVNKRMTSLSPIYMQASFGYDFDYFCWYLNNTNTGIINAPRLNAYCTRFLPLICHEASHPAITRNSIEIMQNNVFNDFFEILLDNLSKSYDYYIERYGSLSYDEIQLAKETSTIISEILADLFSTLICSESYIWAFISYQLWPQDIQFANLWYYSKVWQRYPPNEYRFQICCQLLDLMERKKQASFLREEWDKLKLRQGITNATDAIILNKQIFDLLKDTPLKEMYDVLIDKNNPFHIIADEKPLSQKPPSYLISNIQFGSDPPKIFNSIWRTRWFRYLKGNQSQERDTTKVLNYLYHTLNILV